MKEKSKIFAAQVKENTQDPHRVKTTGAPTATDKEQSSPAVVAKTPYRVMCDHLYKVAIKAAAKTFAETLWTQGMQTAYLMGELGRRKGNKTYQSQARKFKELTADALYKETQGYTLIRACVEGVYTWKAASECTDLFSGMFAAFKSGRVIAKEIEEHKAAQAAAVEAEKRAAQAAAVEALAKTLTPEQKELMKAAGLM